MAPNPYLCTVKKKTDTAFAGGSVRSELRGQIAWLLLCFDGDERSHYAALLQALIEQLPDAAKLLVCCFRQEYATFLQERLGPVLGDALQTIQGGRVPTNGKCFLWVPKNPGDSLWCRDPFLLKQHPHRGNLTLHTTHFSKEGHCLCDALARLHIPGYPLPKAPKDGGSQLHLSGGNLLADEDFLLVGHHEFKKTWQGGLDADSAPPLLPDEPTAVEALLDWANGGAGRYKKVHLVGLGVPYPPKDGLWGDKLFAHLDSYLSLTGTKTVDASGHFRYVLLVARADRVLMPEKAAPRNTEGLLQTLNAFLDGVAQQLADTGDFEVRRNPVPVFAHCAWDYEQARPYPVRFYLGLLNNVLLQVEEGDKQVWLPSLSEAPYTNGQLDYLASLERENIGLWRQLGYDVRLVKANFHPFWHWMGGLRCMTNDLVRAFGQ